MKIRSLIFALSLAANVALLIWLLASRPGDRGFGPSKPVKAFGAALPASTAQAPARARQPLWQTLSPDADLRETVARLRAAGFPPRVLRAMVRFLVSERFDAERYKIDEVALHTPYWQAWPNSYMDPKVGPALRRLLKDEQEMVKQLLGDEDIAPTEESLAWRQLEMGDLPPEKLDRLTAYLAGYNEKRLAIYSAAGLGRNGARVLPADVEKLAALEKSMRDGLSDILTPEEASEFNIRHGDTANRLKWMLNPLNASETEFRTVFPLYQAYLDQFPTSGLNGGANNVPTDPRQKLAEETLIAQIGSVLGQQRAEEMRLALDPKYAALNRLVGRLSLPISAAQQVFAVQQDIQQRASSVRENVALSGGERAEQLAILAKEASAKISTALGGSRGFNAYALNGGQWISSLLPPPKT